MTKKAAQEFLNRVEKDPNFVTSLRQAKSNDERKKILDRNNYSFSRQEYIEAYEEKNRRKMTSDELRGVAAAGKGPMGDINAMALACAN